MASFRIINNFPVYMDLAGNPASGGYLKFYETNTTTPKSVFADPELTIDNGSSVSIGSDGRTVVETWGSGAYRVRLYDADNTLIAEADDVEIAGGDATTIPTLVDGYFLTNNGSLLLWAQVRQMPDPTGQDGKVPVADGSGYSLQSLPEPPEPVDPEIVVDGTERTFQAGVSSSATKFWLASGNDSAPATNQLTSTKALTFDPGFDALWCVLISPTTSGVTSNSPPAIPSWSVTGYTPGSASSGVTVTFYAPPVQTISPEDNIVNTVPFSWLAIGTRTIAE